MKHRAKPYLEIEPWAVVENGFRPDRSRVSESLFSLANEFTGVRGYFDEGYSGDTLVGAYFNGVFDEVDVKHPLVFKGFPTRTHYMINTLDWLHARLVVGRETLDLHRSTFEDFERRLDLRTGVVRRSFVWVTARGRVRVAFHRFLGVEHSQLGFQRIELDPIDFQGTIRITLAMDFSPVHELDGVCRWSTLRRDRRAERYGILAQTSGSEHKLLSAFRYETSLEPSRATDMVVGEPDALCGVELSYRLKPGRALRLDRIAAHQVERSRDVSVAAFWRQGFSNAGRMLNVGYDDELDRAKAHWAGFWRRYDLGVVGDPPYEQGLRFCIFQLHSTYRGVDPTLNIGAKGLSGEVYGGQAFWDTETYCLPFYLFTDLGAARNLIRFRYHTLEAAKQRARELACDGARYPMTTIDGREACPVWWHGDIEIHVPAAVAYAIWHYHTITGDDELLYECGVEMLVEISRFYASHGAYTPDGKEFGLFGVMGADEYHLFVHNNAYTNTMAKKTFQWTLDAVRRMRSREPERWAQLEEKVGLRAEEPRAWRDMARRMRLNRDAKTGLVEQHDGYFDLPDIDHQAIPEHERPMLHKYPYIWLTRFNWIKQPDVLLLHLFFSHDYDIEEKRLNYDYYEPKCTHESSLSPSIHSILAAELGRHDEAFEYVRYASRLDLDDYNGNTDQGLHMTSMAGAWLSLVYGFGGLRSDGRRLSFAPSLPAKWKGFHFHLHYRGRTLRLEVSRETVTLLAVEGKAVKVDLYGETVTVDADGVAVALPESRRG